MKRKLTHFRIQRCLAAHTTRGLRLDKFDIARVAEVTDDVAARVRLNIAGVVRARAWEELCVFISVIKTDLAW